MAKQDSNKEMTIKIDRETYKKLQEIKMVLDKDTIADTIAEIVEIYGKQYKQKMLIAKMQRG